jgi:hypothetical protein
MIGESYRCDVCERSKGATNHWFLSVARRHPALLFVLAAWDELAAKEPGVGHLCGEGCALRALSRALAEAKEGEGETAEVQN